MNHSVLVRLLHYDQIMAMNKDNFYRAIIWVEENLCSGQGVNSLVKDTGCSRRTLEQGFLAYSGFTPGEYLFRRRMTRAAVMLRITSLQITEIAVYLHYHSGQNFTRAFRRLFGMTPTDYRRKEVWNTQLLQHPLLYGDIISHSKVVILNHPIKITGSRKYTYSRYDSMSDRDYLTILRHQLSIQSRINSQDLLIVCRSTNVDNTYSDRRGMVKVETVTGRVSVKGGKVDDIIPVGKYIQYEFNDDWNSFSIFSRTIYLKLLSETNWHCIGNFSFMKVYAFNKHLHCKLYIPVIEPSE